MVVVSKRNLFGWAGLVVCTLPVCPLFAWTPLAVTNDPLVRLPGSQPGQVALESPGRCMNCHAGYDPAVEPGFNWRGSMMSQAARDPIFFASFAVAAQDAIWALGNPNAADLCMRCHFPEGWLEGRSDPPNASLMVGSDYDGVHCDFCHSIFDPFYQATYDGIREGNHWTNYWDETNTSSTPSQPAADATHAADVTASGLVDYFNGESFFGTNHHPASANYTEDAGGSFFMGVDGNKRAPFADVNANHDVLYSRYHKSRYFCGTCHDVSNPALANLGKNPANPLPSETNSAFAFFHIERTFSEFMLSDYSRPAGAAGTGPYAPAVFTTRMTNNYIYSCQDCHMPQGVGKGCNKAKDILVRPTESVEHPHSGQAIHDFMGGNAFVPYLLASTIIGSPVYDETNRNLLTQGPAALTLDLSQGESLDFDELLAARDRALTNLEHAASITNITYDFTTGLCSFRVVNHTGHKLISGFPEGRRMFVNIAASVGEEEVYEINPYDEEAGTLKGLPLSYAPNSPPLESHERYVDELVYEVHPSSSITGEDETFHMALADGRYKDNRIPPKGFRVAEAGARLAEPVWHGASESNYFSAVEYAGGHDDVLVGLPPGADRVEVKLFYQTTSREFIEFLRDELNGVGGTLTGTGAGGDPAYLVQTDPWFEKLRAWGNTLWQLWDHNKEVPGAAPVPMADSRLELDRSDDDGDGIPAYWETLFFGGPTNAHPAGDDDSDRVDNLSEFLCMTLPNSDASYAAIEQLRIHASPSANRYEASFTSHFARMYGLDFLPAFTGTWSNAAPSRAGHAARMTLVHTNTPTPINGMYRLTVTLP